MKKVGLGNEGESSSASENTGTSSNGGSSGNSQVKTESADNKNDITTTTMKPETLLGSNRDDIDWDTIKADIELINSSWNVILIDLYSLGVTNDTVQAFSTTLDKCITNIKAEDKAQTLASIAELYAYLPKFLDIVDVDKNDKNIKQTKSYIVNSYALVTDNLLNAEIANNITNAKSTYENIIMDKEYIKGKENKINKVYVLINELQNSLNSNDIDVFYIKYKSLMEAINTL